MRCWQRRSKMVGCLKMVEAGVDVIELGLPFSDPMADGPVIALAAEREVLSNF